MNAIFHRIFSIVILFLVYTCIYAQKKPVLHAHNDYAKKHPLSDALAAGIRSIEIDVYYHKNRVVVSHIPLFLGAKKDLYEVYGTAFDHAGKEKRLPDSMTLMLDIKSGHDSTTWYALKEVRRLVKNTPGTQFRILLTGGYRREQTGSFPQLSIVFDASLAAFLNGGEIAPGTGRLSCSYGTFRKTLKELGPDKVKERLRLAAAQGMETRVWGAGNREKTWRSLCDMGIRIVNVDKYKKARGFLSQYP
ncbi:MAG: hypothetical protein IBJ09_11040 [Bacteroidia bacterium]|nr:hypothetical protein [Bacteroidia bacterium]